MNHNMVVEAFPRIARLLVYPGWAINRLHSTQMAFFDLTGKKASSSLRPNDDRLKKAIIEPLYLLKARFAQQQHEFVDADCIILRAHHAGGGVRISPVFDKV